MNSTTGEHAASGGYYTLSAADIPNTWFSFDLGSAVVLDSVHVWNSSQYLNYAFKTLDIYTSSLATPGDPEGVGAGDWTQIGTNVTFAAAASPHVGFDLETETGISLPATAVRHVRFELNTIESGDTSSYAGMEEVQFFEAAAIPEPSIGLFGALGVLVLLRRRRR